MRRVLALSLDGYEVSVAERLMADGLLPALARLRERSARFALDHGSAKRTGLGAEHLATGYSPADAGRWSSIHFDSANYHVYQEGPRFAPFPAKMTAKTVAFDLPYFDLAAAPNVRGVSAWGSHDAGTELESNPAELAGEVMAKFGAYPGHASMYALAWPSEGRCRKVGDELARGVERRADLALWLLSERLPDWDLALIGVSECHSALEALWHGFDQTHPLHGIASSRPAREEIVRVYQAVDGLIGRLADAFRDATLVVFSMHGMGPNQSDVASMALLPELMHRHAFGTPFFRAPERWARAAEGVPLLQENEEWDVRTPDTRNIAQRLRPHLAHFVPRPMKRPLKRALGIPAPVVSERQRSLHWMPTARYQEFWPRMRAFVLPSFYDGRIRVNLKGRERNGIVAREDYERCCDEIAGLLAECRNPLTGAGVVEEIERPANSDPFAREPSEADMTIVWKGAILALDHPRWGRVGPVPYRRTGGHTGPFGVAYVAGEDVAGGDYGQRSSFDVVPTLIELAGERVPAGISGESLLRA